MAQALELQRVSYVLLVMELMQVLEDREVWSWVTDAELPLAPTLVNN